MCDPALASHSCVGWWNTALAKELCIVTLGNVECGRWPISFGGWEGTAQGDTEPFS